MEIGTLDIVMPFMVTLAVPVYVVAMPLFVGLPVILNTYGM
jgi:hypothetical protein